MLVVSEKEPQVGSGAFLEGFHIFDGKLKEDF
jgi:hypothetical protein